MRVARQLERVSKIAVSPKQTQMMGKRDWYPYYAGFTESFVDAVVSKHLSDANLILDPWSGTGTTTAVCLKRGLSSKGIDINPALTVIARARLIPLPMRPQLPLLAEEIINLAKTLTSAAYTDDLLENWIRVDAVCRIRSIQSAIHLVLGNNSNKVPTPSNLTVSVDQLRADLCFFYSALFRLVRDLLARFRPTNPMWLKQPPSNLCRIRPSWKTISNAFQQHVEHLGSRLSFTSESVTSNIDWIKTGNAANLPFKSAQFDGALTSPPYATRIDYVRGTLPELAVLGADKKFVEDLRRETTGSPVIRGAEILDAPVITSKYAIKLLDQIRSHSSKGSRAYYYPWMRNYVNKLQAGLSEISRTVKPECPVCVVVQDSYYKECLIDLQLIVEQIMNSLQRTLVYRCDYPAPNRRLNSNLGVKTTENVRKGLSESLLVFN